MNEQLRLVATEVRAVEVVEWPVARRPASPRPWPGPRCPRPTQHHLAEAVEVELADEAGKVGGFEELGLGPGCPDAAAAAPAAAPGSPRAPGPRARRAKQLGLEERLVDEQALAAAVPADGAVPRAVHQPPQLGGEVVGVDGGGQQRLLHRPPGPWASPRRAWLSHRSRSPGPSLRPAPSCQRPAAEARTVGARVPARPSVRPMGPRVPSAWWPRRREPALPLSRAHAWPRYWQATGVTFAGLPEAAPLCRVPGRQHTRDLWFLRRKRPSLPQQDGRGLQQGRVAPGDSERRVRIDDTAEWFLRTGDTL